MERVVIFVDGEYVRKIFMKNGYRNNIPKLIDTMLAITGFDRQRLLRTYFYTSPPYQGNTPTDDEKARYSGFQRFISYLKKQDSITVRLGRLEKRGDDYKQKMVDVLLSIDLVDLSAKSKMTEAILVAGDSDFVPAVKHAKSNGVRVMLFHSADENEYHKNLWQEADIRHPITTEIMKSCSN